MTLEVVQTCPLGSECEEVKDGKLRRCRWYKALRGKDPQSKNEIDTLDCAIAWLPLLTVQMSGTNIGQTQALNDLRDHVVGANKNFLGMVSGVTQEAIEGRKRLD